MIVMEQMLDDKNYDRLKLYMQKLADIAHENEQKIDTGNIELDAILNNKINEAQDSNIKQKQILQFQQGLLRMDMILRLYLAIFWITQSGHHLNVMKKKEVLI